MIVIGIVYDGKQLKHEIKWDKTTDVELAAVIGVIESAKAKLLRELETRLDERDDAFQAFEKDNGN